MKATTVRARIDPLLKEDVESVLGSLGLSVSEAIGMFMAQIKLRRGIPFDVKIPNAVTLTTFKKTDANQDLVRCKNAKDMFNKLGI